MHPMPIDQLFSSDRPYYEVRWKDLRANKPVQANIMDPCGRFSGCRLVKGPGLQKGSSVIFFVLTLEKIALSRVRVRN